MTDLFTTPERRVEGRDKVTGAARYAADITREGMLHAAFVPSPYAHARVVSVDTTAAQAVAGVHAVLTGTDVFPSRFGRRLLDWPVLCWDTVRFIGDRVAVVAAETIEAAEEAARLVDVVYDELPAVFDPETALASDAPVLHPDASEYVLIGPPREAHAHPNIQGHELHEHGDVDAGFARATHVFEHSFEIPRVHQAYIEPRAALVWLEGETVHVVTTNKSPFALREQISRTVGRGYERIVVHTPHVGGDFGGKGLSLDEFALYFLALRTGRPVRSLMRYADELQTSNTRHAARIRLRTGVDDHGRILAHEARVVFDGGAYAAGKPVPFLMPGDAMLTLSGYRVPAARVDVFTVYTNQIPAGHARAPGQPQNVFAAESHIDLIAKEIGIDPLVMRERNAIHAGDVDVHGDEWHDSEMPRVLETVRRESRWGESRLDGHGRGVAVGVRHVGRGKTSFELTLERDDSVTVRTGVTDQGGGALTMIQRVIARELALEPDRVRVEQVDTSRSLFDPGVGGSRVTPVHGQAALDGARKIATAIAAGDARPVTVIGTGEQNAHLFGSYAYVVEVQVDRETGAFRITDALLVADVGTVINPVALRGQLEGGFVTGLGQATMEMLVVEDGRVTTTHFGDYKIPTIADVPPLRISLVTDGHGPGPFGAKSVGELSNPAVSAAIANAIADAVGVRLFTLPLTAERVLAASRSASAR